ncbi:MAG: sulfite exporter TauE/SafE family protein [Solirubrobacterales bacterium]|nr:sulfite exporter TauE/SafE family protein [Solirubrobacterales bacterium]
MHWQWPVGACLAFLLAVVTTPAGVSGAVLLLPIQLSVLHVPSPAVTPTNLIFNVAATPGGLIRFAREGRLSGRLTRLLLAGTLPGVIIGAFLRVQLLQGSRTFTLVAALVLLPIGLWLLLGAQSLAPRRPEPTRRHDRAIWILAVIVGAVGGIYGIGGGSLLAPILMIMGYSVFEVAPATLAATFLTSLVGIATYQVLQLTHSGAIAPEWILGAFLGAGGFLGSYCGARLQRRLPEASLRRLLGLIASLVAVRYLQTASVDRSPTPPPRHAHLG